MARGRTTIKRRPTKGSVKHKVRHDRFRNTFTHPDIAKSWDKKKTVLQNFKALDFQGNTNSYLELRKADKSRGIEFMSIEDVRAKAAHEASKRPKHWVSPDECEYLDRCIAAHSDDFDKMAMDTKVNFKQHSAAVLKRRIQRMELFRAEQAADASSVSSASAE